MNLNYILISSPDKIALTSFIKFVKRAVGKDFIIADMHSLMSEEAKSIYIDDFTQKFPKGIFSYYAKGLKAPGTVSILPEKAVLKSEVIVWFDLYSTSPTIFKDDEKFLDPIIVEWNKYIDTLNRWEGET